MDYQYTISLNGIPVRLDARNRIEVLDSYTVPETAAVAVHVPESEYRRGTAGVPADTYPAVEFGLLSCAVSNALIPYGCCIFHGVAFRWRERAWIFTAPPGTGKTTQYALWKTQFGDELRLLNGDKPLLDFRENGGIWVRPSPWSGKENMRRQESAPLGGVILLEQGPENRIRMLTPQAAVEPIYRQFLFFADGKEQVETVCAFEEQMLHSVPVWELSNVGDAAAARLTHDTIVQWEENR